eukprot:226565_1
MMKRNHTQPPSISLRIDGIGSSRFSTHRSMRHHKSVSNRSQRRPQSAHSMSTFSTLTNQSCRKKRLKRPKTAHYKSKKQLLDESLTRLYPQRVNFIPPHSHRPDEIACALRLQRQYEKTLQKRSKQINKTTKPKFRSLTKNLSCYNTRIRDSQKLLLYESPYHSMNVDQYDYRPLKKSPVPWEFRMYNKPKRFDHFATKTQTVTINTTESYKQMDAVVHNMYRQSVRDFFGEEYDMKTGIDYGYTVNNSKNPVYV